MQPNQFTSVSTQGFGSRIMGAIIGIPVGILLIIGSCILLYWNEGRTDFSKVVSKSTPVSAQQISPTQDGNFVSVTGSVTGQQIGDGTYLAPGSYVAVQRVVEEYAWVEKTQNSSQNNTGGSQTNTTTYTYSEQWVDQPEDSINFHNPQGHQNPDKPVNDVTVRATSGKVGVYAFDPQTIKLPTMNPVTLSASDTITPPAAPAATIPAVPSTGTDVSAADPAVPKVSLTSPQYLYGGTGSMGAPQLGDIRISYLALPTGTTATIFGRLGNGTLSTYTDPQNHTVYHLYLGDREGAISTLHSQYETTSWIIRGVGLVLIWVGMMMLFGPLDVLLSFLPFAGRIGSGLISIITLPLALVLGGTIILVSYTLHHVLALLIAVPLVFLIIFVILKLARHGRGIPSNRGGSPAAPPISPPAPQSSLPPSAPQL